jgi:MFS family permease
MKGSTPGTRLGTLLLHGPRSPFRWTAYALAVTAFAAAIPTPLYPTYEREFHFSAGVLGLMFAAYAPGVLLTLFFLAPQAERLGRRRLLSFGMMFTAAGAALFAVANGVIWLAIARIVCGLAVGATSSVATAAMSDLEPYRDPHHVARVAVAANFGGFAIGALGSGLLVQYAPDPTRLIYLFPIAGSALALLALRVIPETATAIGSEVKFRIQRISVPTEIRRPFWVAAGGVAACYSIYGLFAALVPSYVRTGLDESNALAAGGIVALMFGMAAIVQLATSQIRDRRALLLGFPLLAATLIALVLILPLVQWAPLVLVTGALGAAVGLTFMGSVTLVDRVAPEDRRGEVLAGYYCAGYLAVAGPTIGVAEISERIGLIDAGIEFGAILAFAAVVLLAGVYLTPTPPGGGGRAR